MNELKIQLNNLTGIKRYRESNDKPMAAVNDLLNMRQIQDGVFSRRENQDVIYPDRPYEFQFTTPQFERGIGTPHELEVLHNSHKRKTIALGKNGDTHYTLTGVIQENKKNEEVGFQRVLLYRHKLTPDGVTNVQDGPVYDDTYCRIENLRAVNNYINYSMVMNSYMTELYVVYATRESAGVGPSMVVVAKVTNLYGLSWNSEDDDYDPPVWELMADGYLYTGSDVDDDPRVTHDVDIEIDDEGNLHVVFGRSNTGANDDFAYHRLDFGGLEWGINNPIQVISDETYGLYGCVIKAELGYSGTQQIIMGYLKATSPGIIYRLRWDIDSNAGHDEAVEINDEAYFLPDFEYLFGPVVCVDSDGTVVFGWKTSSSSVYVKIGGIDRARFAGADTSSTWVCWDLIVKDGVLLFYYNHNPNVAQLKRPLFPHHIYRRVMIFNSSDADYVDRVWFGDDRGEIVEESDNVYKIFTAYNTYESDNPKRMSYINVAIPNIFAEFVDVFNYIRQDRGVLDGAREAIGGNNLVVIKQPWRYNSKGDEVSEYITVLQCEVYENYADENGTVSNELSYRFYERGDWQWDLLKGQMNEGNDQIVQETIVDTKAHFWDNKKVLRAGCGIEVDNFPIWYGRIDRKIYDNEPRRLLEKRMFRVSQLNPPAIAADLDDGIATITVLSGELPAPEDYEAFLDGFDIANHEPFYDKDAILEEESLVIYDAADPWEGTLFGTLVSHPFLKRKDRQFYSDFNQDGDGDEQWDLEVALSFIEVFVGFAYRYDNGQISAIRTQDSDVAYKLGFDVHTQGAGYIWTFYPMLQVNFQLDRWDILPSEVVGDPMDPRITGIICMVGEKTRKGMTKFDAIYRPWKEILVAKSKNEVFKDKPEDGDSVWTVGNELVTLTTYLDFRQYEINAGLENAVDYIGTGAVLAREEEEKTILDGYDRAVVMDDQPFFFRTRINGKRNPNHVMWAANPVNGGQRFVSPDVIAPAFLKPFPFEVKAGVALSDNLLVVVGDNNSEIGEISTDVLQWDFFGTQQQVGTNSPDSVTPFNESTESGKIGGAFFLERGIGGRLTSPYEAVPITKDILQDFNDGRNTDGEGRVTTVRKGLKTLLATSTDAMAIHIPGYRIFMIHFPTDGVTFVRDLNAEDNGDSGNEWTEWKFGKDINAWCVAPEKYLITTDGEQLYRYPAETPGDTDAGVAIQCRGRLSDLGIPPESKAFISWLGATFKVVGTGLKFSVIYDNGKIQDDIYTFLEHLVKEEFSRKNNGQKPAKTELALAWELETPEDCTEFELHRIFARGKVYED